MVAELFETLSAGKTYLLLLVSKTNIPEIYSLITDWPFGENVCIIHHRCLSQKGLNFELHREVLVHYKMLEHVERLQA